MAVYIVLGIVVVLVFYLIGVYNGIIRYKNMVLNAWSGIDVQLKRRADLIPNLVETVKSYVKHEKELLESLTKARTSLLQAGGNTKDAAAANDQLSGALKSLFMVAENYPDLKSNQNFLKMQEELSETEDQVAASRRIYNENVNYFNTRIQIFPNVLIAGMLRFDPFEFFEAEEKDRENVQVKF